MRCLLRISGVLILLSVAVVVSRGTAEADPGIGVSVALGPGALPGTVSEPPPGAPVFGPVAPPPILALIDLLTLPPGPFAPGVGQVQDISYGDEMPLLGPLFIEFSTGIGATGHPAAPPPGAPLADVRQEEGIFGPPPFGDTFSHTDVYQNWPAPLFGPPPCAFGSNVQILDGDGAFVAPFFPRLGLGLPEPGPAGNNLDAYERSDEAVVDFFPAGGDAMPDAPVFFTIDPATAAAWPGGVPLPGPFGFAIPGPSDVIAWDPVFGTLVIWATAGMLTLVPGDDIDALAVDYGGGPIGAFFGGAGPDLIVFSLAPGSPSLSPTSGGFGAAPFPEVCSPPGAGTAADLWFVPGPFAIPIPYIDAEQLGLNTFRSGGGGDDDLDAVDICNGFAGTDIDGDTLDDACDFDMDGDGTGNSIDGDVDGDGVANATDNCTTVPNGAQTNSDSTALDGEAPANSGTVSPGADVTNPHADAMGDACDTDDDNDGLGDGAEPAGCNGSGALSPTDFDSDNDLFPDGYECTNGTIPDLASSRPPYPPTGALDSDGDGVLDSVETLILTLGGPTNFDGGACGDGRENASVNLDSLVNSADLSAVAQRFGMYRNTFAGQFTPGPAGTVVYAKQVYDFNRDGTITSADLSSVAQRFVGVAASPC